MKEVEPRPANQNQDSDALRRAVTDRLSAYPTWVRSVGVPVYQGYFIEDLATVAVEPWPQRGCRAAFLELAGQEGVTEARITEIPPGATTRPLRFALDEVVYVVDGRGIATVHGLAARGEVSFEWHQHSMFLLPRHHTHELANTRGSIPARLLHYNYLPLAMSTVPDPSFFFNNPYDPETESWGEEGSFYSQARRVPSSGGQGRGGLAFWVGNFLPDVQAWDGMDPQEDRGVGAQRLWLRFPHSTMSSHLTAFPPGTYKKAHRHGPGVLIAIVSGEGYSVMWPEGGEKQIFAWRPGSAFVPPNRWFHQHFNVGSEPARYVAFFRPSSAHTDDRVVDPRDQIEYADEDPEIRHRFETELERRGLSSRMPSRVYEDRSFAWAEGEGGD